MGVKFGGVPDQSGVTTADAFFDGLSTLGIAAALVLGHSETCREVKSGAVADFALEPEAPTHHLRQFGRDRQP